MTSPSFKMGCYILMGFYMYLMSQFSCKFFRSNMMLWLCAILDSIRPWRQYYLRLLLTQLWNYVKEFIMLCDVYASKKSLSSPTWVSITINNPSIIMVFNLHELHYESSTFQLLQFHLGGDGLFNKDGSFHSSYQNNNS